MRNSTAQPIIRTVLEHLAERRSWSTAPSTIAATDYVDPDVLARERSTLFTGWPQAVALSPDLPEPGSVVTRDQLGFPVVLTRDEQGVVHGFANVCAHRGSQVVPDGRDCTRRLTCPYHAWSYDLTGALVGVPDRSSFPGVELGGPGLRELPTLEAHGVIWLIPDLSADPATPIAPQLGAIADDLDHFDIAAHRYWRSHRFDLAFNWKLVIDTFFEPYHFASLHRNTVAPIFTPNLCWADRAGHHVREVLPRRSIVTLTDEAPDTWDLVPHAALVYLLFPNTVFVLQIDHIEMWRVVPHRTDPGRSVCDVDFFVPDVPPTESSERHWEKNWQLTIDTVIQEDFHAMAGAQRGLASGAIDSMRIGANEPAISLFHASLAEAIDASAAPEAAGYRR
jgi:nitrite reductase/ring-hydroxylating ferredoxin subunit